MPVPPSSSPFATVKPDRRFTYDTLCAAIGETNEPHELWHGRLVHEAAPGYGHQRIVQWFARALFDFAEPRGLGQVVASPVDMLLTPDTCLQPDVVFIATPHLHRIRRAIEGPADLVAEVVSPWHQRRDREAKRSLYERFGIKEYWIIDPEPRIIEVLPLSANGWYRTLGQWEPGETAKSVLVPGFELKIPSDWPTVHQKFFFTAGPGGH